MIRILSLTIASVLFSTASAASPTSPATYAKLMLCPKVTSWYPCSDVREVRPVAFGSTGKERVDVLIGGNRVTLVSLGRDGIEMLNADGRLIGALDLSGPTTFVAVSDVVGDDLEELVFTTPGQGYWVVGQEVSDDSRE